MPRSAPIIHASFASTGAIINKNSRMASLVELTVATVALHTPVPELLAYIEYLPTFIRHMLFKKLSKFRLREMEVAWEAAAKVEVQEPRDGFDPLAGDKFLFDRETQRVWEARWERLHQYSWRLFNKSRNVEGPPRNCRHVFWGEEFESMLSRRTQQHLGHVDELMENQKLFVEVVRELRLSGAYICKANAEILLALRYLRRLEVQYFHFYDPCWETMRRLVKGNPHLTELKFMSGRLSDIDIAHLYTTLAKPTHAEEKRLDPCRITALEFVRVKLPPEGYRRLVALVGAMPQLLHLRVEDCINNFNKKLLVDAALCLPALERLFLRTDRLEDDAFGGLAEIRKPLTLRYLHLDNNNVSLKTVKAICQASLDGVLNLERLGLSWSNRVCVSAIHALLASPVVGSATVLTHLDLRNNNISLEGVTSLLLALSHNKTLTHLNVGSNKFNVGFGDVLAEFLLTNSSLTHLKADRVYLEQDGVSARLLTALESNLNLTSLSLVRNQLRSGGASAVLRALIKRAQVKSFTFVDLSENKIKLKGLKTIAEMFEGFINTNGMTIAGSICTADRNEVDAASRKRQQVDSSDKDQRFSFSECGNNVLIQDLRLEDNYFGGRRREYTTLIKSIQRRVGHLRISD